MSKQSRSVLDRTMRLGVALPLALVGMATSTTAFSQDAEPIFEEIVVTVQKREQNIMDVPVAVSALSGAQIAEAGIKDMFDLQQNVPGLIVGQSQTATSTNFSIRGIGSTSNNFGVESSVGLYVDGVYRSRQSSLINDLADIETVEISRGPQGTLYGKNTPSGAISIRTVRPSHDREAFVDVTVGDLGLTKITGAANFSINDNVAMRATLFSSTRDGYVDDANFGKDFYNDKDRFGGRLQLAVGDAGDDFNMRVIADYAEIDEVCCAAVSLVDGIYSRVSLGPTPQPGSDAILLALGGTVYTDYPYPQPFLDALAGQPGTVQTGVAWDDFLVSYDTRPRSTNEDSGLSVEFNKLLGNDMTLTSITGYRSFETFDRVDGDFTNVPLILRTNQADQSSFSQELRFSGEFGEGSSFVFGGYYFGQDIDTETFTGDPSGPAGLLGQYIGAGEPALAQIVAGVNAVAAGSGGTFPPAANPFPADVFSRDNVSQDHEGWAVFGQVDWALSDAWTLTLGGRYTDEEKQIDSSYEQTAQGPAPDLDAIGLNLALAGMGMAFDPLPLLAVAQPNEGWGTYNLTILAPRPDVSDSITDDQVTGTAKITWYPSETAMVYLSYATGFKSGGTNVDRVPFGFTPLFDAETTESVELGLKGDFGPVRLSVAIYDTDYEDFQAQTFTGTGFNLQNAGKLSNKGYEIEALWRPTDSTEIQAHYSHTEGKYDSFLVGTCMDTAPFHTGIPDPGEGSGLTSEQCDKTGFNVPYNPEDRTFIAITQDVILSNSVSMYLRGEYSYASSQFTDGDLDPFTKQGSVDIVNLRIGFNLDNINSNLTLWGRNITDERYYHGSFDQPLGLGRMNAYPSEPATYGLTFRKDFD